MQGRTMWLGYLASLERSIGDHPLGSDGCIQLNVNVTAGFGVPEQSLQHFIGALSSGKHELQWDKEGHLHSFWKPWDRAGHKWMASADEEHWWGLQWLNAEKFGIRSVKATTAYMQRSRVRTIRGISSKPPHALWFKVDGEWKNVRDYFQQRHGISLSFPFLPCVDLGNKADRQDWVPIELVRVLGGLYNFARKVSPEMLDVMIQRLAVDPAQRLKWIENVLWDVPDLQGLGAEIRWSPRQLTLRRMPAPMLQCGATGRGSWNTGKGHLGGNGTLAFEHGFFNPSHVRAIMPPHGQVQWMILNYLQEFQWKDLEELRDEIVRTARARGASFDEKPWLETDRRHDQESSQGLQEYLRQHARQLDVVVALLPPSSAVYWQLKAECASLGLFSACLNPLDKGRTTAATLAKKKVSMFVNKGLSNLGTLVHLKSPHRLLGQDAMVLGLDVRHEHGSPSIAGAVASFGHPFTHYWSSCRAQAPRVAQAGERQRLSREHIEDLEGMVEELLQPHCDKDPWWAMRPRQVIVFRDGVSEGQFPMQQEELLSLYRAFEKKGASRPKVVWIVVQKRHQTRFFPERESDQLPNGNVVPGVVADKGIAHPHYENWFAVSHKAIKGTAVPAHYFVLHNTTDATKDELVEVTNQMCHLYPRASCAVSYPTPAYYADHLCERAFELGIGTHRLFDCAQLNKYFQGTEFRGSPLQGKNFFC